MQVLQQHWCLPAQSRYSSLVSGYSGIRSRNLNVETSVVEAIGVSSCYENNWEMLSRY